MGEGVTLEMKGRLFSPFPSEKRGFIGPGGFQYRPGIQSAPCIGGQIIEVVGPFGNRAKIRLPKADLEYGRTYFFDFVNPGLLRVMVPGGRWLTYRPKGKRWDGKGWVKA